MEKICENLVRETNYKGVHLIGNVSNGSVIGLNEEGYGFYKRCIEFAIDVENLRPSDKVIWDALKRNGFFIPKLTNKLNTVYLHVTGRCNLRCSGCYAHLDRNDCENRELTTEELKRVISNIARSGAEPIIFSGGEPMLRSDIIELAQYAKMETKIKNLLCISNGTFDVEEYKKLFKWVDRVFFSLDGDCAENSYIRKAVHEKVISLISNLEEYKPKISVIFTLHHRNYVHLGKMTECAKMMGVNYNYSIYTTEGIDDELRLKEEDLNEVMKWIKKERVCIEDGPAVDTLHCSDGCGAGKYIVGIDSNGKVFPCHMFLGNKEFCLGDVLRQELKELVEERDTLISVDKKSECKHCDVRYMCGGGCAFRSYACKHKIKDKDPLCTLYKENIENIFCLLLK